MNLGKIIERYQQEIGRLPLALITGGSSGMGKIYAQRLAEARCSLLLVSNQKEELQQVSDDLRQRFNINVLQRFQDLAVDNAGDDLFAFCQEQQLEIDILINNAGMFFFEELTPDNEARAMKMMQLHIFTPTRLCLLFGNEMKQRGHGYILNMSSMAAQLPCPGIAIYSASKAYLKSFSKSLFFEMRPYGVGVTTVCPAAIATPLYKLKPSLLKLGVKFGVIGTPQWLVKRALRGLFHKRRVVKPGLMNYYLPPLVNALPKWLVAKLWKKFK